MRRIKAVIKWILRHLPAGNYIVLESVPDLSDNTKAVYEEMIRQGFHKKYRMFWWVNGPAEDLPKLPNTAYLRQDTWLHRFIFRWITCRAKCLISCNNALEVTFPFQKSFYLTHGTALKKLNNYYLPEGISYTLIASEAVKEVMVRELKGKADTFFALGYPRNDVLQSANTDLKALFGPEYQKIVVWYPTFRQHKGGHKTAAINALPILYDTEQAVRLNEVACKCGLLIVIKPHFAQDLSYIKDYNLSNIRFIDDRFFKIHKIDSYTFVGSCDALITDYSSIYFDYLLCDKPVAVIWEDIGDYRIKPGFAMDPEQCMAGAEKIYTIHDFEAFLRNVAEDNDPCAQERRRINLHFNYSADGKNSERVVAFIKEKAAL